ncbi:MAG TPA: hypothetical protein VEC11_01300 [Allosphingosinicella sp.]|nr:hypothetical protein [Allosphingosinicella sp.]
MADYRLYLLNDDGHIFWARDIDADSDEAALEMARAEGHQHDVEVWQGRRKVGAVHPEG